MTIVGITFDPDVQPPPILGGRYKNLDLLALELVVATIEPPSEEGPVTVVHLRGVNNWRNRLWNSISYIPVEKMDELARKWLQMRGQLPLDESQEGSD